MDAVIARNVRVFREAKNWSQQHLAATAGIALRTVQRVECAQRASRETLAALSNALDAPVELLQTDIEEWFENMRRQQEALLKTRDLIAVHPVTGPEQLLNAVVGADASLLQCHSSQGEVRDAFALLATSIRDLIDIAKDMTPLEHHEWAQHAFSYVATLRQLGAAVTIGRARRPVGSATKPVMEVDVVYVLAWPLGEEKPAIAVEKITSLA